MRSPRSTGSAGRPAVLLSSGAQRSRQELYLVGRADLRHRPVRAGFFRDFAARGGADGPAAAAAAGARLARGREMPASRPSRLAGTETGVYIGASSTDYSDLRLGDPASADAYFMTGNTLSILANRISYVFDLRGPSLAVDTACSSSLVALHHACEAIRGGRIGSADRRRRQPAAGALSVSRLLPRLDAVARAAAALPSTSAPTAMCAAKAAASSSSSRSPQALADGDPVRAVILGTGVNSDGRTIGLSLPSEAAQTALLRSVYAQRRHRRRRPRVFRDARHRHAGRRPDRGRRGRPRARPEPVASRCRSARSRPISATWSRPRGWPA